ncbi:MAG: GntR family transcriptional regulator [Candidatus Nanopelagicales bacterium]
MPTRIRTDDFTPLYIHISRYLRGLILDGELQTGEVIPSELDLVKKFGTTRGTVRAAVDVLVNEKLVKRVHGKGTFVRRGGRSATTSGNFGGFAAGLGTKQGLAVAKVVSADTVERDDRRYFELVRLRGIASNGSTEYFSLDTSLIPLDLFPGIGEVKLREPFPVQRVPDDLRPSPAPHHDDPDRRRGLTRSANC